MKAIGTNDASSLMFIQVKQNKVFLKVVSSVYFLSKMNIIQKLYNNKYCSTTAFLNRVSEGMLKTNDQTFTAH